MVTTFHNFSQNYPVKRTDKRMIVGTIHPHQIENFTIPFFYGNTGSFWDILGNAFPNHNFETRDSIINVLNNTHTWITDMILQCDREDENVTQDKFLYNILFNTAQITEALNESEIDTIYFTSRFGVNNAASLFCREFGVNFRQNYDQVTSEFIIDESYFGRQIRCIVLFSPSNLSNMGIAGKVEAYKNNIEYYQQFPEPVKQFKIEFYREKFAYLNE